MATKMPKGSPKQAGVGDAKGKYGNGKPGGPSALHSAGKTVPSFQEARNKKLTRKG